MSKLTYFAVGIFIGLAILAGWRFFTYQPEGVHYHANFAVYVNGERELFNQDTYYEELTNCSINTESQPFERAHLHDHINDVIHIEAEAVTWGQFFENLGWGIGPGYLQTRTELLVATNQRPLTYILNGDTIDNPANRVIGNVDKLLVSYGEADDNALAAQFASIADTANAENSKQDPDSCGGQTNTGWRARLEHVLQ